MYYRDIVSYAQCNAQFVLQGLGALTEGDGTRLHLKTATTALSTKTLCDARSSPLSSSLSSLQPAVPWT